VDGPDTCALAKRQTSFRRSESGAGVVCLVPDVQARGDLPSCVNSSLHSSDLQTPKDEQAFNFIIGLAWQRVKSTFDVLASVLPVFVSSKLRRGAHIVGSIRLGTSSLKINQVSQTRGSERGARDGKDKNRILCFTVAPLEDDRFTLCIRSSARGAWREAETRTRASVSDFCRLSSDFRVPRSACESVSICSLSVD
jgi:hypothetical protein